MKITKNVFSKACKAKGIIPNLIIDIWKLMQSIQKDCPKSSKSAWIFFTTEKKKEDSRVSAKELGTQWASLSSNDKDVYIKLALDDKKRYIKQMEKWNTNNEKLLSEQQTDKSKFQNMNCKDLKVLCREKKY